MSPPSASLAKPIRRSSNGIGGIDHRCLTSTVQPNSSAARSHASSASVEHRRELVGVEVALVEQQLGAAGDRRHHARLAARAPGGAVAALVREPDLADVERGARRRQERVLPHVHRRRARVGRPPAEHRGTALDPDRAQHGRCGLVARLENRALLDVQLE